MGLRAGWLALFLFVWIIGAFLGSTFEYQNSVNGAGISYTTGTATFTNGSTTVTGLGTAWVNGTMAGGNIKADADGVWYRIASVSNATTLVLDSAYYSTGGAGLAYTMAASPGWAGTGTGGYTTSPVNKLEYLSDINNVHEYHPSLGVLAWVHPDINYFKTAFEVVTWRWSFLSGYEMVYWIFLFPFVAMGILSMILLIYEILAGKLGI
jgi:hypothetical protein